MRATALLPLLTLASACATTAPRAAADVPDTEAVRAALQNVELLGCDEITCNYRGPRRFEIRALSCRPDEDERGKARCTFLRRLLTPHGRIAGQWHEAETSFMRFDHGWVVARDWTPDRD